MADERVDKIYLGRNFPIYLTQFKYPVGKYNLLLLSIYSFSSLAKNFQPFTHAPSNDEFLKRHSSRKQHKLLFFNHLVSSRDERTISCHYHRHAVSDNNRFVCNFPLNLISADYFRLPLSSLLF